jgi:hypothetical protein
MNFFLLKYNNNLKLFLVLINYLIWLFQILDSDGFNFDQPESVIFANYKLF